ncbi:MAG: hypothetical protein ACJ74U_09205 [Jatrophihabitantaceae bacterium]
MTGLTILGPSERLAMIRRLLVTCGAVLLASSGLAGMTAPAADAAISCSGTIAYDHTYFRDGNPVAEITIYYNSTNGGTNSACLYHRGAYYGKTESTSVGIARCTQHSAPPGSTCSVTANPPPDDGFYAYYAGPVGVTGAANYCVEAYGNMWLGPDTPSLGFNTGTRGC